MKAAAGFDPAVLSAQFAGLGGDGAAAPAGAPAAPAAVTSPVAGQAAAQAPAAAPVPQVPTASAVGVADGGAMADSRVVGDGDGNSGGHGPSSPSSAAAAAAAAANSAAALAASAGVPAPQVSWDGFSTAAAVAAQQQAAQQQQAQLQAQHYHAASLAAVANAAAAPPHAYHFPGVSADMGAMKHTYQPTPEHAHAAHMMGHGMGSASLGSLGSFGDGGAVAAAAALQAFAAEAQHAAVAAPAAAAAPAPVETVFRMLCPSSRAGSVLGKGGCIIRQLREETGARIKLGEAKEGMDERVIGIAAVDEPEAPWSAAQEALFRIHTRIVEGDGGVSVPAAAGVPGTAPATAAAANFVPPAAAVMVGPGALHPHAGAEEGTASANATSGEDVSREEDKTCTRLIVPASQIGCLLGKGGSVIERMRQESGAHIRVLSREQHPLPHAHALEDDDVLQVSGEVGRVRAALQDITQLLRANPPKTGTAALAAAAGVPPPQHGHRQQQGHHVAPGGAGRSMGMHTAHSAANAVDAMGYPLPHLSHSHHSHHQPHHKPSSSAHPYPGGSALYSLPPAGSGEACFRILCPVSRVGVVIGKGGSIVQQMREETGARFKITGHVSGCDERVIVISAPDDAEMPFSAVQEGLFRVHTRLMQGDEDDDKDDHDGEGAKEAALGAVAGAANDARTAEGGPASDNTHLTTTRLLVPASQIGCLLGKRGAIIQQMREETSAQIRVLPPEQVPWSLALHGDELVQIVGTLPAARAALHEISTRLRASPARDGARKAAAPTPAVPTTPEGVQNAGSAPASRGLETVTALRGAGLAADAAPEVGDEGSDVVTVTVAVPAAASGSIIGRGGSNIRQVRELSGARVKMHEATPGATKRMVEMTGTLVQVAAAQQMIDGLLGQHGARLASPVSQRASDAAVPAVYDTVVDVGAAAVAPTRVVSPVTVASAAPGPTSNM